MSKGKPKRGKRGGKRRKRAPADEPLALECIELPSPYEGMTQEEAEAHARALRAELEREFAEAFGKLQSYILKSNPLHLLSSFAVYGLAVLEGRGWQREQPHGISQHHVELLQALLLRHENADFEGRSVLPRDFEEVSDLLGRAAGAFHLRRLREPDATSSLEERARARVVELVRVHTQVVRNWGYLEQVADTVRELFEPLEDDIERVMGVRIEHLIEMCKGIAREAERRINEHFHRTRPILKTRTISGAADCFLRSFPDADSRENLLRWAEDDQASLTDFQWMLICLTDTLLPDVLTFAVRDFVDAYPVVIQEDRIVKVLERWSLGPGELAKHEPEHLFMRNPVWFRPLIPVQDGTYFWPILGLFHSFCLEMMLGLIEDDEGLRRRYEKRRAVFLEDKTEDLFRRAFTRSQVYRGSEWHDPVSGKTFENDLLVLIDSHLIIIEAKSGRVTWKALRGEVAQLTWAVKKLIVAPSEQSERFEQFLRTNRCVHHFPTKRGEVNEVDGTNVRTVLRMSVTLELMANLILRTPLLQEAGLIPHAAEPAPTFMLSDLENVFQVLESACEKIHYITRRAEFERNADYAGTELDLLGFYLETGFNIGEAEFDGSRFILDAFASKVEPYLIRKWEGEQVAKPRTNLTPFWRDLLVRIAERRMANWTECSCMLLNVSRGGQRKLQKGLSRIRRFVRNHRDRQLDRNICILVEGPPQRRTAIAGVAYSEETYGQRKDTINFAARRAMEQAGTDRAVVIARNVDREDYPYGILAYVDVRES